MTIEEGSESTSGPAIDPRELSVSVEVLTERLGTIREAIDECGRHDVEVVAVTKGFNASAVRAAKELGLTHVGENYAQELIEKSEELSGVTVNFLGRIQRNKVRKVHEFVDLWQSVARPEILIEIAKRSAGSSVLIQIQPDGDETKDGIRPAQLPEMFELAQDHGITIAGLMTIGVLGDRSATIDCFREVDGLAAEYGVAIRSMGMSGDFRDALEAGSTMLRVGSALFGSRPVTV